MVSQTLVCLALTLITARFFSVTAKDPLAECSNDQECFADSPNPSFGDQLLQVGRMNTQLKSSIECTDARFGKTIPLTKDGFKDVAESCCYDDMIAFVRRVVESAKLQVCHEGGLSGFAPYYSCSKDVSFAQLKDELSRQMEENAPCNWLGHVHEECATLDPSCGITPLHENAVLKGYIGLESENNPPALVTNPAIRGQLAKDIAKKLDVPESSVRIIIGTGPVGSASFYQVAMKSSHTGKYVQAGPDGSLLASSASFTTVHVKHQHGENFLVGVGSKEFPVKWNKTSLSFQSDSGEDALEDDQGRLVFGRNSEKRLQVDFPGLRGLREAHTGGSLGESRSLISLRRSCTVMVSFEIIQTDPPTLDEDHVKDEAEHMDVKEFESIVSHDLDEVEPCLGEVEISTVKFCKEKGACKNKSLRPAHTDREYNHTGNHVAEDDKD